MASQRALKSRQAIPVSVHDVMPRAAMNMQVDVCRSYDRFAIINGARIAGDFTGVPRAHLRNAPALHQYQWISDTLVRRQQGLGCKGKHRFINSGCLISKAGLTIADAMA